jgi:hypothetical protein
MSGSVPGCSCELVLLPTVSWACPQRPRQHEATAPLLRILCFATDPSVSVDIQGVGVKCPAGELMLSERAGMLAAFASRLQDAAETRRTGKPACFSSSHARRLHLLQRWTNLFRIWRLAGRFSDSKPNNYKDLLRMLNQGTRTKSLVRDQVSALSPSCIFNNLVDFRCCTLLNLEETSATKLSTVPSALQFK